MKGTMKFKPKCFGQAHNQRTEKTERNRQICKLRRVGLTFEEIGANFGITMQAASKIYNRDKEKYE